MQKLENLSTKSVDFDFEKIWGGILDFWRLVRRRTEWLSDAPWASKMLWRPHRMALGRPLGLKNALASAQNGSRTPPGLQKRFGVRTEWLSDVPLGLKNALASAQDGSSASQAPPSTLVLKIWQNFFSDENRTINTPLKSILDHWRPPGHP